MCIRDRVIVLLGANLFILVNDEADSYGDKGILHRIQQGIYGIFTDEMCIRDRHYHDHVHIVERFVAGRSRRQQIAVYQTCLLYTSRCV